MALGHLWSLACEMQFYTLAPLIFLFGKGNKLRAAVVYGSMSLILMGMGFIIPVRSGNYEWVRYHFEVAAWPMMLGFYCEFSKEWVRRFPRHLVKWVQALGIGTLVISIIIMSFGIQTKLVVIAIGLGILPPCLVSYVFESPFPGRIGQLLAWMGVRTYSIYLWQQPLTLCRFLPSIFHPVGAALSVIVGECSFRVFEKPFLADQKPGATQLTQTIGH